MHWLGSEGWWIYFVFVFAFIFFFAHIFVSFFLYPQKFLLILIFAEGRWEYFQKVERKPPRYKSEVGSYSAYHQETKNVFFLGDDHDDDHDNDHDDNDDHDDHDDDHDDNEGLEEDVVTQRWMWSGTLVASQG